MSIESTLYSVLAADGTVTGLVSDRIYPMRAPEEAAEPFIVYQVIASNSYNKLGDAPDTERKVVQIGCVSPSYDTAKAIAEAVKRAMETEYGYMVGEMDDYFPDTQNFRVLLDWAIHG